DLERFLAEDSDTYVRMGFTQLTLGFNGPAWAVDDATAWLAWRDRQNSNPASHRQSETATDSAPPRRRPVPLHPTSAGLEQLTRVAPRPIPQELRSATSLHA